MRRTNPFIAAAADVRSSSVKAIWPATKKLCVRFPRPPPVVRRELDCMSRARSGQENSKAGASPNSTPVRMAIATENIRTGRFTLITASCGKENSGSRRTSTGTRPIGQQDASYGTSKR